MHFLCVSSIVGGLCTHFVFWKILYSSSIQLLLLAPVVNFLHLLWGHEGMVSINILYDRCLKLSLDFTQHGKSEGTKLNDFSSFPKVSYFACLWIITSGSAYEKQKKDHLRKWSSDKWKCTLHQYISKNFLFLIVGFRICYGFLSFVVVSTSDCGLLFWPLIVV
jgi:hypothetical protein